VLRSTVSPPPVRSTTPTSCPGSPTGRPREAVIALGDNRGEELTATSAAEQISPGGADHGEVRSLLLRPSSRGPGQTDWSTPWPGSDPARNGRLTTGLP
jgi:hypothetical protein